MSFDNGILVTKNYKGATESHLVGDLSGLCRMAMTHYRVGTHGGRTPAHMLSNVHPFFLTDCEGQQLMIVGAHNGIFSDFGVDSIKSDTVMFFEQISSIIPAVKGDLRARTLAAQRFLEHIFSPTSPEEPFKTKEGNIAAYVKSSYSKVGLLGIGGWHLIVNADAGYKEEDDKGFVWRSNNSCMPYGAIDVGGRSVPATTNYSSGHRSGLYSNDDYEYEGYGNNYGTGAGSAASSTAASSTKSGATGTGSNTAASTATGNSSVYSATVHPDGRVDVISGTRPTMKARKRVDATASPVSDSSPATDTTETKPSEDSQTAKDHALALA